MEQSLEASRNILNGIVDYMRLHTPWNLQIVPGGIADQKLPPNWQGDGIIARPVTAEIVRTLLDFKGPRVLLDPSDTLLAQNPELAACGIVENDYAADGKAAAEYFLERGFVRFAYVGPSASSVPWLHYNRDQFNSPHWSVSRLDGFAKELSRHGYCCKVYTGHESTALSGNWELEKTVLAKWLDSLEKPIAIFAANDARGRQVAEACHSGGIPVPYQVSILAVNDDSLLCETSQPPLSSIPLDARHGGYIAAEFLDLQFRGRSGKRQRYAYGPLTITTRATTDGIQTADPLVIAALEIIRKRRGFRLRTTDLSDALHVSVRWLEQRLRRETGRSVAETIRETCLRNVASLVSDTDMPFADIARECGQLSPSHLAEIFRRRFGVTMSEYRRNNR